MASSSSPDLARASGSGRRLFRPWWLIVAAVLLIFAVVNAVELSAYFLGTRGTGRIDRCVSGDSGDPRCIVEWTAGSESGYASIENLDGEPGERIAVRVLGDNVVDGRVSVGTVLTLGVTALAVLVAALILTVPPALIAMQARRRSRAQRRMADAGEQVLLVQGATVRHRDGTPYAMLGENHPGPEFPPSSCRVTVTSPAGHLYYTVHYGMEAPRRRETVVYGAEGQPLAVVRRQLVHQTRADVFGPDAVAPTPAPSEPASSLATLFPSDRLGPVQWVAQSPRGERLGAVLPGTDGSTPTLLGIRPGLPEPLRAGLLGFALTWPRISPEPALERADDAWFAERARARTGTPPPQT